MSLDRVRAVLTARMPRSNERQDFEPSAMPELFENVQPLDAHWLTYDEARP